MGSDLKNASVITEKKCHLTDKNHTTILNKCVDEKKEKGKSLIKKNSPDKNATFIFKSSTMTLKIRLDQKSRRDHKRCHQYHQKVANGKRGPNLQKALLPKTLKHYIITTAPPHISQRLRFWTFISLTGKTQTPITLNIPLQLVPHINNSLLRPPKSMAPPPLQPPRNPYKPKKEVGYLSSLPILALKRVSTKPHPLKKYHRNRDLGS